MKEHPTGPLQLDAVQRLLRSSSFLKSREASTHIVDDADALRALVAEVRDRGYGEGSLSELSAHIDAALLLLDDLAESLTCEGPMVPPARTARHRLLVAALHYLARVDDAVPDSLPGGDIDDAVVLREVLGAADADLRPYLDREPDPADQAS